MKNGTIPFFSVFGKQKTGQSREKRDSWQVCSHYFFVSEHNKAISLRIYCISLNELISCTCLGCHAPQAGFFLLNF